MTQPSRPHVLPLGVPLGSLFDEAGTGYGRVRRSGDIRVLKAPNYDAWMAARFPVTDEGQAHPLDSAIRAELIETDLAYDLGEESADQPLRWPSFRLVPMAIPLGNSLARPDLFALASHDAEVLTVLDRLAFEVWMHSDGQTTLKAACLLVANSSAEARHLLARFITVIPALMACGAAFLD